MAGNGEHSALRNRSHDLARCYPRNADGPAYGSGPQTTHPDNEPDLIQVCATNGKTGYVCRTDISPSEPASPCSPPPRPAERDPTDVIRAHGPAARGPYQ